MKNFVRIICEKIVNVVFYLYFYYYKFVVTFWCSVKNICIALILFSRTYNNERSVWNAAPGVPLIKYDFFDKLRRINLLMRLLLYTYYFMSA